MKSISNLSTALIIAAAIVLIGNILNLGLSSVAAANVGIIGGTYSLGTQALALYCLSGILFSFGVALAVVSIVLERKREKYL